MHMAEHMGMEARHDHIHIHLNNSSSSSNWCLMVPLMGNRGQDNLTLLVPVLVLLVHNSRQHLHCLQLVLVAQAVPLARRSCTGEPTRARAHAHKLKPAPCTPPNLLCALPLQCLSLKAEALQMRCLLPACQVSATMCRSCAMK